MITLVSGGKWIQNGDRWLYEGNQVSSGLLTTESILYVDMVKLIRTNLGVEDNIQLKLSYSQIFLPGIPPIHVLSQNDLRAYMFTNSRGPQVFQTPLYCEVITEVEETEVLSTGAEVETQTQCVAGDKELSDRKRKRESKTVPTEVVCLSSDEEEEQSEDSGSDVGEVEVVDISDDGSSDSDDSYLWSERFTENLIASRHGDSSSRSVIDLADDFLNNDEDDDGV